MMTDINEAWKKCRVSGECDGKRPLCNYTGLWEEMLH